MAYKLMKKQILSGSYDAADVNKKLEVFLAHGSITVDEFSELKGLMAENEQSAE